MGDVLPRLRRGGRELRSWCGPECARDDRGWPFGPIETEHRSSEGGRSHEIFLGEKMVKEK